MRCLFDDCSRMAFNGLVVNSPQTTQHNSGPYVCHARRPSYARKGRNPICMTFTLTEALLVLIGRLDPKFNRQQIVAPNIMNA